jgi:hydrophobic/amphiphilic exporter-1 (mainly G- bacteria), HAE1 family
MAEIEALMQPLRDSGEITNLFSISGTGSNARGFMVMTLAPWNERAPQPAGDRGPDQRRAPRRRRRARLRDPAELARHPRRGPGPDLRGHRQRLRPARGGGRALVARMQENPAFGQVRLEYETTQPQLFIEIDRTRASDLGIEIAGLGDALRAVLDGRSVGTVFLDDTSYDIQMLSTSTR